MKESIGGTWIFAICMTFILLFSGYLAIQVNYSKAFRLKNTIVTKIEEKQKYDGAIRDEINLFLTSQGYSAYGECSNTVVKRTLGDEISTSWTLKDCIDDAAPMGYCNACIYELQVAEAANRAHWQNNDDICADKSYYKIVTFFKFDLPIVNELFIFKISGDTKYIMGPNQCIP